MSALGTDFTGTHFVKSLAAVFLAVATSVAFAPATHAGPYSVTPIQGIDMGTVGPDADASGTASIDLSAIISTTGGASALGGTPTVGTVIFGVAIATESDTINTTFSVTPSITLTGSAGGSITFDNIQHDQPPSQPLTKPNGDATVQVTGRANLSANQTAGRYSGSLIVTATDIDNPLLFDTHIMSVSMGVVQPISISKVLDLSLGAISSGGTPGTVSINRSAVRSVSGGVTLDGSDNGTYGQVTVTGEPNQAFTFAMPPDNSIVLSNGLGDTVTIQSWDIPAVTALDGTGVRSKRIGGTLAIGANQAGGTYTSTFNVTATYD